MKPDISQNSGVAPSGPENETVCPKPKMVSWVVFALSSVGWLGVGGISTWLFCVWRYAGWVEIDPSVLRDSILPFIFFGTIGVIILSLINAYFTSGKYRWLGWGVLLSIPLTVVLWLVIAVVIFVIIGVEELLQNLTYS